MICEKLNYCSKNTFIESQFFELHPNWLNFWLNLTWSGIEFLGLVLLHKHLSFYNFE